MLDHIVSYHANKWKCNICFQQSYSADSFEFHRNKHTEKERAVVEWVDKRSKKLERELQQDFN